MGRSHNDHDLMLPDAGLYDHVLATLVIWLQSEKSNTAVWFVFDTQSLISLVVTFSTSARLLNCSGDQGALCFSLGLGQLLNY